MNEFWTIVLANWTMVEIVGMSEYAEAVEKNLGW